MFEPQAYESLNGFSWDAFRAPPDDDILKSRFPISTHGLDRIISGSEYVPDMSFSQAPLSYDLDTFGRVTNIGNLMSSGESPGVAGYSNLEIYGEPSIAAPKASFTSLVTDSADADGHFLISSQGYPLMQRPQPSNTGAIESADPFRLPSTSFGSPNCYNSIREKHRKRRRFMNTTRRFLRTEYPNVVQSDSLLVALSKFAKVVERRISKRYASKQQSQTVGKESAYSSGRMRRNHKRLINSSLSQNTAITLTPGCPPHDQTAPTNFARFRCSVSDCDRSFKRKGDCRRHEKTHATPEWACNCCSKQLSRKDKLKDHIANQHSNIVTPEVLEEYLNLLDWQLKKPERIDSPPPPPPPPAAADTGARRVGPLRRKISSKESMLSGKRPRWKGRKRLIDFEDDTDSDSSEDSSDEEFSESSDDDEDDEDDPGDGGNAGNLGQGLSGNVNGSPKMGFSTRSSQGSSSNSLDPNQFYDMGWGHFTSLLVVLERFVMSWIPQSPGTRHRVRATPIHRRDVRRCLNRFDFCLQMWQRPKPRAWHTPKVSPRVLKISTLGRLSDTFISNYALEIPRSTPLHFAFYVVHDDGLPVSYRASRQYNSFDHRNPTTLAQLLHRTVVDPALSSQSSSNVGLSSKAITSIHAKLALPKIETIFAPGPSSISFLTTRNLSNFSPGPDYRSNFLSPSTARHASHASLRTSQAGIAVCPSIESETTFALSPQVFEELDLFKSEPITDEERKLDFDSLRMTQDKSGTSSKYGLGVKRSHSPDSDVFPSKRVGFDHMLNDVDNILDMQNFYENEFFIGWNEAFGDDDAISQDAIDNSKTLSSPIFSSDPVL